MKTIGLQSAPRVPLPPEAPVMVLPGGLLFPHALVPLYIFEPRYQAMLAHALDEERMFCIALLKPDVAEATSPDDFHHVAGLGLVRACVGREDGTSNLILQGLARVQFTGFVQEAPFRIARLRELVETPVPPAAADSYRAMMADTVALCSEIPAGEGSAREQFRAQLEQIGDPSVLADVVAHTFVREAEQRQEILECLDVSRRLRLVQRRLRELTA